MALFAGLRFLKKITYLGPEFEVNFDPDQFKPQLSLRFRSSLFHEAPGLMVLVSRTPSSPVNRHGISSDATHLAHCPALGIVAVGARSGVVNFYGAEGLQITAAHLHQTPVRFMAFLRTNQGHTLLSIDRTNVLCLWSLEENALIHQSVWDESWTCATVSACSKRLFVALTRGQVVCYDFKSGMPTLLPVVADPPQVKFFPVGVMAADPRDKKQVLVSFAGGRIYTYVLGRAALEHSFNAELIESVPHA
ncbi:hypothetical protein H696_03316 [Fonticula alba]|uniref:Uncharacterized protein n=1 Tax=Fonticula alba TaxID=691883 RepID=A0A058Z6C6_FONAL|nr:hypothetical protein H696_03316 [Fonticula alba]KCV69844.1 hypothetical protein H696_03316 [Fonticula alba]|eukprot:XP_009495450.1 hypothetical protein H696_03316 [Fonticula alba]